MKNILTLYKKIINKVKQIMSVFGCLWIAFFYQSIASAAECEHRIVTEWSSGFVANIRISNNEDTVIENWSVSWQYPNAAINSSWNANISGSNPYTATDVGWNRSIYPGQSIEFGFVGSKATPGTMMENPTLTGDLCGAIATPTPTPSPSPGPNICADIWETLIVTGLNNNDQIVISWNEGWSAGFTGPTGNRETSNAWFGYCGPINTIPPRGFSIVDDGGYFCAVDYPMSFWITVTCDENALPTPIPFPTPLP